MKLLLSILLTLGTWSLDGLWQFRFIETENNDSILHAAINDSNNDTPAEWDSINVPANWEIARKKEPEYGGTVTDCHGIYRCTFTTPDMNKSSHLILRFEGVLFSYDLYVNKHFVGYWSAAFCRKDWDITSFLSEDGNNTIVVDVSTRSRNLAYRFDLNDDWALTGIFRSVTLIEQPACYISDHTFSTKVINNNTAVVCCHTSIAHTSESKSQIRCITTLRDNNANIVAKGDTLLNATLRNPHLWSAETPYLYTLHIELRNGENILDSLTEKVGIREVSIAGDTLLLNRLPLTLRGVCMNELHPDYGRAIPEDVLRKDLQMMKRANINYIRTAHYPFQPVFYRLCDEMGFYVITEVPFGYGDSNLTDTTYLAELLTRAKATISINKNHPSIIIWSVGNENPYTTIVEKTIEYVRDIDPTRPRTIPGYKVSNTFLRDSTSEALSLFALHYQSVDKIEEMASYHLKPIILTEYSHSLGLAFDALESQQSMIRRHSSIAGGSVWVWADQALKRTRKTTDCITDTIPQGVWLDSTTYYDSYNDKGTDGIVFANRYPQEDYYQLRKLYSPIWVEDSSLTIATRRETGIKRISFVVNNRYDFTGLRGYTCCWTITDYRDTIAAGEKRLRALPHKAECITLTTKIRHQSDALLHLAFISTEGDTVYEHNMPLTYPSHNYSAPLNEPILHDTSDIRCFIDNNANLILMSAEDTLLNSPFLLRVGRKPSINLINLITRNKLDSYWLPYIITPEVLSCTRDSNHQIIKARWHRQNSDSNEFYEGNIHIYFLPSGAVHICYDIHSRHASGTILELGLTLRMSPTLNTFAWLGKGPFSSTPHKSILNERDIWYLDKDDIRLIGNRADVSIAAAINKQNDSHSVIIIPTSDLGVENIDEQLYLTDTRILSSYGTKLSRMMVQQKAHQAKHAAGDIYICPISRHPEAEELFLPLPDIKLERPFLKIYDH